MFNGAGEDGLPTITQAWSVRHLDETRHAANVATLQGIADILRDYPDLQCEVHGETGHAPTAPRPLADHLRLHYHTDVQRIMDYLARQRAEACRAALVSMGVPERQLFVTHTGRGGNIKVEFVPQVASEGSAQARDDTFVPLPAGIPFRMRLKTSSRVIHEGVTEAVGEVVACALPRTERLYVAQTYLLEALAGPGTEPNACEFSIDPATLAATDALEVRLPVRRCPVGQVNIVCRLERHGNLAGVEGGAHWTDELSIPQVVYDVLRAEDDEVVATGVVTSPERGGTLLGTFGLQAGSSYRLRVPETKVFAKSAPTPVFTLTYSDLQLVLPVRRQVAPVTVSVSTRLEGVVEWARALPLPPLFEISLVHRRLRKVAQNIVVERAGGTRCASPR